MQKRTPRIMLALGWYEHRVHQGIAQYALKAGWHLCGDVTKEKIIPWGWQGDGVLAWLGADDELARFVMELKLPTVDFSCRRMELPFARVIVDYTALVKLVADHFLRRGLRHFMYYSAQDNWAFDRHGQSFVKVIGEAGYNCEWIRWHKSKAYSTGHTQWQEKRRWLATELKKAPKPLALFAATDDHALEIIEVCENIGIRVPEEVSVVGVDNSLPAVEAMRTPISSVDQNFAMQGYCGAELLDKLMHGKPAPPKPILIAPAGLIARKSSDLLAVPHPRVARSLRFMWDHCHEPIGVNDMAQAASMSLRNFHQAFVDNIGRSPGQELQHIRIERAKKLLSDSNAKMEVIAKMCGYESANSFWVAFKRLVGLSPKQYQKKFAAAVPQTDLH
jgi:LacI family transcriptional regulator